MPLLKSTGNEGGHACSGAAKAADGDPGRGEDATCLSVRMLGRNEHVQAATDGQNGTDAMRCAHIAWSAMDASVEAVERTRQALVSALLGVRLQQQRTRSPDGHGHAYKKHAGIQAAFAFPAFPTRVPTAIDMTPMPRAKRQAGRQVICAKLYTLQRLPAHVSVQTVTGWLPEL
ncbi:hypothetical protein MMC29_000010 [Sticta canariensis]|nr:hypothetical protein [Sticta canariensis]